MRNALLGAVWGIVLLATTGADARTISISIGQRAELRDGMLVVKLNVSNGGDEAAKSVTAKLRVGDDEVRGKLHDELGPSATFEEELSIRTGQLGVGRWPFQIAVDYADANQYPFQALHMTTIVVGQPPIAKVSLPEIAAAGGIAEQGTITVKFKNLAGAARELSYRLAAPEGLEAKEPTGRVSLAGWGDASESVAIINRTALAGSRYPVFVAVEYDEDGVHHAVVQQGMVEIVPPRDFWKENQRALLIGAGVLVAVWLVFVLMRAVKKT
jgi:hypothetical protein